MFYAIVRKIDAPPREKTADVIAETRGPGARAEFCQLRGAGVLQSFGIDRRGELASSMMALEARRRLEHFYDTWLMSNDEPSVH